MKLENVYMRFGGGSWFCIFFSFFGCTGSIWKFLGQGLNPSHICDICLSCSNAESLTHHARIKPAMPETSWIIIIIIILFCLFAFSRAAPTAYGGSQARDLIRTVATGLCQSHSNAGSEPRLQPTPQLTAMPDA